MLTSAKNTYTNGALCIIILRRLPMELTQIPSRDYIYARLFEAYVNGESLQALIQLTADLLLNPIIVINVSYQIIGHSNILEIADSFWLDHIKNGFCPYEFIVKVNTLPCVKEGKRKENTYEVWCEESQNTKLVSKLKNKDSPIGNVIMMGCKRDIRPEDYTILEKVAALYSMKLSEYQRPTHQRPQSVYYENLLLDLIERKHLSGEEILSYLELGKLTFPSRMYVLSMNPGNFNSSDCSLDDIRDNCSYLFHRFPAVYYREHFIAVCDGDKLEEQLSKIQEFLYTNHIYVGISRCFRRIEDFYKFYQQSLKAITLGRCACPGEYIIYYSRVQYFEFLEMADYPLDSDSLCHPYLLTLKEYDKAHNNNLFDTLYQYIINDGNMQKTAADLFIHRNTVRYRMDKIQELVPIDFSNIAEISNVFISYRIMNYLGEKERHK